VVIRDPQSPAQQGQPAATSTPHSGGVRRLDARDLLGDHGEVLIVHGGREYRLRITSNGKLILTA
jgi:hemin uptake protein HemP